MRIEQEATEWAADVNAALAAQPNGVLARLLQQAASKATEAAK